MELFALFLLAFGGAITPGPDILLVMRNALLFGFWQGFKVFSGIASGWIFYLAILYFGFGYILQGDIVQIVLSVAGACYLLYIAFMLAKSTTKLNLEENAQDEVCQNAPQIQLDKIQADKIQVKQMDSNLPHTKAAQPKDTYLKALLINLSNPKAMLFFSVIVAPFIQTNLAVSLFVLFCGLSSAFLSVLLLATFCRHIIQDRIFHIIDKVCAFLFVGFALLLLYHAYALLPNLSFAQSA